MKPRRRYVLRRPPLPLGDEAPGQRELAAVQDVVHAFLNADRPEEAFQFALDRVGPVVGAAFASVYVREGASELMRLVAAHNWPERYRPWLAEVRVRVGFGPSGEAASERRVIEVPDVFADPDLEDWQDVARELGFGALVALPLPSSTGAAGTVTFYFTAWSDFTTERRLLLRLVADLMASAAEKTQLLERVRRAEAAAVEALTELDKQYIAVSGARRTAREFIANAVDALQPALDAAAREAPSAASALRILEDLVLLSEVDDGALDIAVADFDARAPLRDAMAVVSAWEPAAALQAEEPGHELPPARGDRDKTTLILARLLARAASARSGQPVRAVLSRVGDTISYRIPGRPGEDVRWRLAAALAAVQEATLEPDPGDATMVVLTLPIGGDRDGESNREEQSE